MDKQYLIPTDPAILGYVAGIIDGEGCITIRPAGSKGSRNPALVGRLTIGNTDERLMLWLVANIGGTYRPKKGKIWTVMTRWKTPYDLELSGARAASLLKAVYPYLVLKKEQASLLIQLAELKRKRNRPLSTEQVEKEAELKAKLHVLNQRGRSSA